MNNNSKILAALLGGIVAGTALGLLFAPAKGSETRKQVSDAAKKISDKAKEKISDAINKVKERSPEMNDEETEYSS